MVVQAVRLQMSRIVRDPEAGRNFKEIRLRRSAYRLADLASQDGGYDVLMGQLVPRSESFTEIAQAHETMRYSLWTMPPG